MLGTVSAHQCWGCLHYLTSVLRLLPLPLLVVWWPAGTCPACTLHSHCQANKVPQERVPADVAAKVTAEMLDAFQAVLGPAGAVQLPKTVFTRCGAA